MLRPWGNVLAASFVLAGSLLPVAHAHDEPPGPPPKGSGPKHVRLSAAADVTTIHPGETFTLGLTFDIDPDWHIYWNGQNETGLPPTWDISLPEGFRVGEALWPAPARHISPGDILDHVYERSATILLPVTAPAAADLGKLGKSLDIQIDAKWLVCSEACIPETGHTSLSLGIDSQAGSTAKSPQAPALAAAKGLVPQSQASLPKGVTATFAGRHIEFRAPGASKIEFFPSELSVAFERLLLEGSAQGESLRAEFSMKSAATGEPVTEVKVDGILAIFPKESEKASYYHVSLPPK